MAPTAMEFIVAGAIVGLLRQIAAGDRNRSGEPEPRAVGSLVGHLLEPAPHQEFPHQDSRATSATGSPA
jgi:hypothetical protein